MQAIRCRRQIGLWEIMLLVAGAAAGLAVTKLIVDDLSSADIKFEIRHWISWVCLSYAILLGMTMSVSGLLVVHRLRTGYRWKTGAMAWFAIGCVAWLEAVLVASDRLLSTDGMFVGFGLEMLTCGLHIGGMVLFFTCLASGRTVRQWWRARGWWPEWSGIWLLALISFGGSSAIAIGIVTKLGF